MDLKSAYQIQQRFIQSDKQFQLQGLLGVGRSVQDFLQIEQGSEERDDEVYDELIFIETESQVDCIICGVKCENEGELYKHHKAHYNEEQLCDTCLIKLPDMMHYQSHLDSHHPDQSEKTYCCGNCPLTFKYQSLYKLHLTSVHPISKTKQENCQNNSLKCEECSKVCRTKHSYKSHIKGIFNHQMQ